MKKTANNLPWHSNTYQPEDKALCLIVLNGKIVPDVFIYRSQGDKFFVDNIVNKKIVEIKVLRSEVDGWIYKFHIPLPPWIKPCSPKSN